MGAVQVGCNILKPRASPSRSRGPLTFKSSGNGLECRPISPRATLPRSTDMSWRDTYRQLPYEAFWKNDRPVGSPGMEGGPSQPYEVVLFGANDWQTFMRAVGAEDVG